MRIIDIVKQELLTPRGTHKVTAALGELLTASTMFDLWMYQCLKGSLDIDPDQIEHAGRRSATISKTLSDAWKTYTATVEDPNNYATASAAVIPTILATARELRSFLGNLEFYDDSALSPLLGPSV